MSGSVYEGELENGKAEGKGVFRWADGSQYEGRWKDNMRDGSGTMIWANGDSYTGDWKMIFRTVMDVLPCQTAANMRDH